MSEPGKAGERRVFERVPLSRIVTIISKSNTSFAELINVSLGGVLIKQQGSNTLSLGDIVNLATMDDDSGYRFKVVRTTSDGLLGLSIDRGHASLFGLAVIQGIFDQFEPDEALIKMSLNALVAEIFGLEPEDIKPELNLYDDLGMTSEQKQDFEDLVAEFFNGVELDVRSTTNIGDVFDHVMGYVHATHPVAALGG